MSDPLVLFGTGSFAEVARFLFDRDSSYEVVAFTAESEYIDEPEFCGLPVLPFEEVEETCPPATHDLFVAVGYRDLNRIRSRIFEAAGEKGYDLATYVSSKCTDWSDSIGRNCFVFEDNTLQPFTEIGDDVVLWSGNHIGHHTVIENHCFVASHAVISGHCTIGHHTFIGVNATLRDDVTVGPNCLIGAGALIMSSTNEDELYVGDRTRPDGRSARSIPI